VGFRDEKFLDNERERINNRSASRPVSFANERREVGGRGGTGRFSLRRRRFQMEAWWVRVVEPFVDHADAEDILNSEYVKHSIEEHVSWQVIETVAGAEPGFAEGGWPGKAESC
jgi:hypothetical protein